MSALAIRDVWKRYGHHAVLKGIDIEIASGEFTVLAPDVIPRTYHSVAVLLPDARVFSGGGGLCGSCTVNPPDGRIFTPPYLLQADGTPRPRLVLTAAPSTASPGDSITVTTDAAAASFALVRTSAVTHGVNNDQKPYAWFVSYAMTDQGSPVAVAVVVEDSSANRDDISGGGLAAPIAKQVMQALLGR